MVVHDVVRGEEWCGGRRAVRVSCAVVDVFFLSPSRPPALTRSERDSSPSLWPRFCLPCCGDPRGGPSDSAPSCSGCISYV